MVMKRWVMVLLLSTSLFSDECPKDFFAGHDIIGKGVYDSSHSDEAIEMASLIAHDDLAKQVSSVFQEERSKIENEAFATQMTTRYSTILEGYEVVSKQYDPKTHRAKVVLRLRDSVARAHLCRSLQKH